MLSVPISDCPVANGVTFNAQHLRSTFNGGRHRFLWRYEAVIFAVAKIFPNSLLRPARLRPFLSYPIMSSAAYLPFLIQAFLAAAITAAIIGASHFFGQRSKHSKIKDSAYECGVPAEGLIHTRFSVKFYLTALLFMLFDLEIVILVPILFFIGVLVLGLFYEIRKGALDWEK
jgi:NADH-quinone oxidoreductase subunit A